MGQYYDDCMTFIAQSTIIVEVEWYVYYTLHSIQNEAVWSMYSTFMEGSPHNLTQNTQHTLPCSPINLANTPITTHSLHFPRLFYDMKLLIHPAYHIMSSVVTKCVEQRVAVMYIMSTQLSMQQCIVLPICCFFYMYMSAPLFYKQFI